MAKKYDMRLNIYLDENEEKDKILIDFLNKKYSPVGFIKETIYALATGEVVQSGLSIQAISSEPLEYEPVKEDPEEFEPIKNINEIEM